MITTAIQRSTIYIKYVSIARWKIPRKRHLGLVRHMRLTSTIVTGSLDIDNSRIKQNGCTVIQYRFSTIMALLIIINFSQTPLWFLLFGIKEKKSFLARKYVNKTLYLPPPRGMRIISMFLLTILIWFCMTSRFLKYQRLYFILLNTTVKVLYHIRLRCLSYLTRFMDFISRSLLTSSLSLFHRLAGQNFQHYRHYLLCFHNGFTQSHFCYWNFFFCYHPTATRPRCFRRYLNVHVNHHRQWPIRGTSEWCLHTLNYQHCRVHFYLGFMLA